LCASNQNSLALDWGQKKIKQNKVSPLFIADQTNAKVGSVDNPSLFESLSSDAFLHMIVAKQDEIYDN